MGAALRRGGAGVRDSFDVEWDWVFFISVGCRVWMYVLNANPYRVSVPVWS